MLTHGTIQFLTSMDDLPRRLVDHGEAIAAFLRQLTAGLDVEYGRVEVAGGERSLLISIAPDRTPRVWVIRPGEGEREDETRLATRALATVPASRIVRAPILLASAFWVGPEAVEMQSFGTRPGTTLPPELFQCVERLATRMEKVLVNDLLDEFWREPRPPIDQTPP